MRKIIASSFCAFFSSEQAKTVALVAAAAVTMGVSIDAAEKPASAWALGKAEGYDIHDATVKAAERYCQSPHKEIVLSPRQVFGNNIVQTASGAQYVPSTPNNIQWELNNAGRVVSAINTMGVENDKMTSFTIDCNRLNVNRTHLPSGV